MTFPYREKDTWSQSSTDEDEITKALPRETFLMKEGGHIPDLQKDERIVSDNWIFKILKKICKGN